MFKLSDFNKHVSDANSHFARFKESSLEQLIGELTMINGMPTMQQKQKIQDRIFFIPHDKQQKYQKALNYLATSCGVAICGRPTDPVMELQSFRTAEFLYHALDANNKSVLNTSVGGYVPVQSLHHVFDFKFKSSTGNLASLANVWTREHVKFRQKPGGPPFNNALADTPIEFNHGESTTSSSGYGRDDHMTKPPCLICADPLVAGELVADQWYQYSIDKGVTWENIPGAAYNIIKGVRKSGNQWVFYFIKNNWAVHNQKNFHFEAEYAIDPPRPRADPGKTLGRCGQATISDISRVAFKVISMK